jgi:hypothetical protein
MQRVERIILVTAIPLIACGCGGSGTSGGSTATPQSATPTAGSTEINDTDPAIIYSRGNSSTQDWDYFKPSPEDYQQDEHSSSFVRSGGAITGVGVVVNFSGTGITWIGKKGPK